MHWAYYWRAPKTDDRNADKTGSVANQSESKPLKDPWRVVPVERFVVVESVLHVAYHSTAARQIGLNCCCFSVSLFMSAGKFFVGSICRQRQTFFCVGQQKLCRADLSAQTKNVGRRRTDTNKPVQKAATVNADLSTDNISRHFFYRSDL